MPLYADRTWHPVPAVRRTLSAQERFQECMAMPKEFIPPAETLLHALETLKTNTSLPAAATGEMERAARTLDRTSKLQGAMTQEMLASMHLSRAHRTDAIEGLALLHQIYHKVTRYLDKSFQDLMRDIDTHQASMQPGERAACDRFLEECLTPIGTIRDTMEKFNKKFGDLGAETIAKGR